MRSVWPLESVDWTTIGLPDKKSERERVKLLQKRVFREQIELSIRV